MSGGQREGSDMATYVIVGFLLRRGPAPGICVVSQRHQVEVIDPGMHVPLFEYRILRPISCHWPLHLHHYYHS